MFDEVIVAVDDDEAALDALALGKILASPGATLTLAHVDADGSAGAKRAGVDPGPARDTQPPRPLLRYDGSLASQHALKAARRLAAERHAKLSGFEAVQPRPGHDPFDARHEIDQRIAAARRRLAALGDVEPHAGYGRRAEELARFGASIDLLMIGPRDREGESALHRAPLAPRLAHHAPCPVLVVAKPVTVTGDDR